MQRDCIERKVVMGRNNRHQTEENTKGKRKGRDFSVHACNQALANAVVLPLSPESGAHQAVNHAMHSIPAENSPQRRSPKFPTSHAPNAKTTNSRTLKSLETKNSHPSTQTTIKPQPWPKARSSSPPKPKPPRQRTPKSKHPK